MSRWSPILKRLNIKVMMHRDHLVLPATVDNLPRFREFAVRACVRAGAGEDDGFALKLAVDEVCSNIIEHGYGDAAGGQIELIVELDHDEIRLVIIDTGRPFRPQEAPRPDLEAGWEDRPVGGLGWHLIRNMVDELRYESGADGNRLTLVRRLGPRTGTQPEGVNIDGRDG